MVFTRGVLYMRFMEVVIEDIKGSRQLQSWHNLMLIMFANYPPLFQIPNKILTETNIHIQQKRHENKVVCFLKANHKDLLKQCRKIY